VRAAHPAIALILVTNCNRGGWGAERPLGRAHSRGRLGLADEVACAAACTALPRCAGYAFQAGDGTVRARPFATAAAMGLGCRGAHARPLPPVLAVRPGGRHRARGVRRRAQRGALGGQRAARDGGRRAQHRPGGGGRGLRGRGRLPGVQEAGRVRGRGRRVGPPPPHRLLASSAARRSIVSSHHLAHPLSSGRARLAPRLLRRKGVCMGEAGDDAIIPPRPAPRIAPPRSAPPRPAPSRPVLSRPVPFHPR
jgi:hypothetical protein